MTMDMEKENPSRQGKSVKEQLEYQKRLHHITHHIHSARDTDEILLNLQEEILGLFDADRITVYVADPIKNEIVSKFMTGSEVAEIRVPINHGSISGFCAASLQVVNINNVYDRDALNRVSPRLRFDKAWDQATHYQTRQVLAAPIIYNSQLQGVIQLINRKAGEKFTAEDQSAAMDIATVLGVAFYKNSQLMEKTLPTRFDSLVERNMISRRELDEAMARSRKDGASVESVLMADFHVSPDAMGQSLSEHYRTRFIQYDDKMPVPGELLKGLRPNFLKKNNFVPVVQSGDVVVVAMENPKSLPARDIIKRLFSAAKVEYCVSLKEDIHRMIDRFFELKKTEVVPGRGSIEDIVGQLESPEDEAEKDSNRMAKEDSIIVKIVNKMIVDAYNCGASDIHIEPRSGRQPAVIRIRVDGACQVYQHIPYNYKRALVSRIKIMSDLDIAEKRLPQDGKIRFKRYAPMDIELRVATIPTAGGNEDVVIRILKSGSPIPLEEIGMTDRDYGAFMDMITKPYGLVLVAGPTGSGKTTTLHSAMYSINRPETKIWTAEDPVEITQEGLRQVQVRPRIGLDFATAMRSFLRADPDVIMVGEMRDHETMSTAIEASLTGHLVFSTLHTNSAPETVTRLLDMGMDPFNFADAFLGVLAQRLAKTLCETCREKYHPSREEFDRLVRFYDGDFDELGFQYNDELFLYRATGCAACSQTGYRGRSGLFELLRGTDEIRSLIQTRAPIDALRKQAGKADGMTTLMQDGIRKVMLGLTDIQQVRRVCIR
jgi:type II secretory ATPase GspE/PulE/Tfp pilus assembly ATPase PilB-like protein